MHLSSYVVRPRREQVVTGLFFALLLVLGLCVYRDYGVSWDEPVDRENGVVNLKYVAERLAPQLARQQAAYATIPPLAGYPDNDHGVAFELPLAALSMIFARGDSIAYYHLRHLLIFGVFWVGCWALYGLARQRFGSWLWALLTVGLLVLSPRFFAEAFFNGKDIVFMACFTVAMYTLMRLLANPTTSRVVLHALATALAIDVRVPGLLLVGFTIGMLGWHFIEQPAKRWLQLGSLYVALSAVFVVIGSPYLWEAPVANFWWAYQRLSHYPADTQNIYFGQLISSRVPWHYLLVWIGITTPLPYLLGALAGLLISVGRLLRRGVRHSSFVSQLDVLFLGWLLGPLLLVIGLRSTFYDGWRHLYFIYPAMLLLAVRGIRWLVGVAGRPQPVRYLALGALLLGSAEIGHTLVRMVQLHPHQQVYFSFLPARTAERLFDRDYWGLSYYHGLRWLLHHQAATTPATVSAPVSTPLIANSLLLSTAEQARLHILRAPQQGRYFITNYRWHPHPYPDSLGREIYTIRAEGLKILSIFDREAVPTDSAR